MYFRKIKYILLLIIVFMYELFHSTFIVIFLILKPKLNFKPGIISYPLEIKSDLEIMILANLITLTPGTCSIDISKNKKILYIHIINITNYKKNINDIKSGFEKKIIEIFK